MSNKKIQIGVKPTSKSMPDADAWVDNREAAQPEPTKRLSIDVPESLHRAIKLSCVSRGVKMADELRELVMEKYGKQWKR